MAARTTAGETEAGDALTLVALDAGGKRYAIDVHAVEAVVPLPHLRPIALAPEWVAGVFQFFDRLVPVVDLCRLHGERPARARLGTRVIVTRYPLADGSTAALGLMAENVTDILEVEGHAEPTGLAHDQAPWLEGMARDDGALVQVVDPSELLTDEVRRVLFPR